jgi:hypothetical protein
MYRVSARRWFTRCAAAFGDESLARADRSEQAMLHRVIGGAAAVLHLRESISFAPASR